MFEDKLKTTDWEATNEAIEEQIARESYLQWCRDNMQRSRSNNTAAGSATSSTVTSAEALTDSDASPSKYSSDGCSGSSSGGKNSNISSNSATTLSNSNVGDGPATGFTLSPKTLSQFTHKLPPDVNELGGYDSDATDMSSTSSVGHCGGGNASPNTASVQRASKLSKSQRRSNGLRGSKKRRHEAREGNSRLVIWDTPFHSSCLHSLQYLFHSLETLETPMRKSPKRDAVPVTPRAPRAHTPEAEQRPCTSKQSSQSPPKRVDAQTMPKQSYSSFYQELLEASYANDGTLLLSDV